MSEVSDEALRGIARAIGEEEAARVFYAEMSDRFRNPDTKATFARLSREEKGHRETLMRHYESWTGSPFGPVVAAGRIQQAIGTVKDGATAVDALRLAQLAEKDAHELYTRMAEITADEPARGMFSGLASMEWNHWEILEREIKGLVASAADDALESAGLEH